MLVSNNTETTSSLTIIAVLEPVSCGREYLLKAKQMGFCTILITADIGERKVPEKYRSHADILVKIDTNDDDLVIQKCIEIKEEIGLDAVVPGFEYYVPLAAKISKALSIPGLDPDRVDVLRLKHRMREQLVANGLRAPLFFYTEDDKELKRRLKDFPYPVVVKPVDGSGSMNVVKANNLNEAINAFQTIARNVNIDMEREALHQVLIEEYLNGPELSVEGYVENEKVCFLSITRKFLSSEPYFVELGHIIEANFTIEQQLQIKTYTEQVVKALGVLLGPFHCELRLTEHGPVLIEIGARLPGGQISELIEYAKDIDIYRIALNCYLGRPNPQLNAELKRYAGIKFLLREGLHQFSSVSGFEEYRTRDWVKELTMYYKAGDYIPNPTSWLGRIGYGIFTADSYEQLYERMEEFDNRIVFL